MLYTYFSTNLLVNNVTMSGATYHGIGIYSTSGVVENSTINSSVGTTGIEIGGTSNSSMTVAEGNTIYGEIAGNSYGSAIYVDSYAEALNNTVYNSNIGITLSGTSSVAVGNQVYGNLWGILVHTGGMAQGNTVFNNTFGIIDDGSNTTVENNTLYGNTTGIQIGQIQSAPTTSSTTIPSCRRLAPRSACCRAMPPTAPS